MDFFLGFDQQILPLKFHFCLGKRPNLPWDVADNCYVDEFFLINKIVKFKIKLITIGGQAEVQCIATNKIYQAMCKKSLEKKSYQIYKLLGWSFFL